ncbi:DUF1642 domain-containing protein [Enterococcus avium]|uniref:DUF1642 domain-containing protein n=1 Tax=Enterococcus avium TaxID=33945 RepID=UPI001C1146B4|nr:DUF1642 domain-containing protein [Enterococcus avium]MBU5370268.1 DUF1642 domain-containing protein [Enterococcus avium]
MNKQEKEKFIEKILSWGSWCNEVHTGELDRYVKISKVRELIKCVNEPQKVKVPAFVAELLDYYRNSTDVDLLALLICFKDWYFRKDKTSEYEEAINWLVTHPEQFMKAWLDGYEVEESKWVVNEGDLVIHKGEHEAKVYFVESVDDDGILLVNGIKDEFFTDGPERAVDEETLSYFYGNFRLLAKKESLEVEKV